MAYKNIFFNLLLLGQVCSPSASKILIVSTAAVGHINPLGKLAQHICPSCIFYFISFQEAAELPCELPANISTVFSPSVFAEYGELKSIYEECLFEKGCLEKGIMEALINGLFAEVLPMYNLTYNFLLTQHVDLVVVDSLTYGGRLAAEQFSKPVIINHPILPHKNLLIEIPLLKFYSLAQQLVANTFGEKKLEHPPTFNVYNSVVGDTFNRNCSYWPFAKQLNSSPIFDLEKPKIYVNLGSVFPISTQLEKKLNDALGLFLAANPLFEVIWTKFIANQNHSKYVDQMSLLCNSQTIIFITHGGLNSMNEAIICKSPMIIIPQNFDQFDNAEFAQNHHYGRVVKNINSIYSELNYMKKNHFLYVKNLQEVSITRDGLFYLDSFIGNMSSVRKGNKQKL